jgi:hypothetical protein
MPCSNGKVEGPRKGFLGSCQNVVAFLKYERTVDHALAVNRILLAIYAERCTLSPPGLINIGNRCPVAKEGKIPGEDPPRRRTQHSLLVHQMDVSAALYPIKVARDLSSDSSDDLTFAKADCNHFPGSIFTRGHAAEP